jgi:hypothetical protein
MSKLKIAIIDTYMPDSATMSAALKKYYQRINVNSYTILSKNDSYWSRTNPNSHGPLVTFFASRPLWDCEFHCIEALNREGRGSFEEFMAALTMCRDIINPHVINASLGFNNLTWCQLRRLVKISRELLAMNIVLVAAAGNEAIDPITGKTNKDSVCYPAKCNEWAAVGSSEDDAHSYFSSLGKQVDYCYDGERVTAYGVYGAETVDGTSFCAPKDTGVRARIIQESWKLNQPITNYQESLYLLLSFMAKRKRSNTYDMIQMSDDIGAGSNEHIYQAVTTSYDRYIDDNNPKT